MQQAGKENYWSPYIAGACAGLVLVLSVWFTGKYFGASTSFVRSAGLIEKIFSAERVDRMDYFIKTVPKIEWQGMFVLGILIGALAASRLSRTFKLQAVPDNREAAKEPINMPKTNIHCQSILGAVLTK